MGDLQASPPLANEGPLQGYCHPVQQQLHPLPTNLDLSAISGENWQHAEKATGDVLKCIQPMVVSEQRRKAVVEYVQKLIKRYVHTEVFPFGSVPLKTYLPDGDIDLTAIGYLNCEDSLANDVWSVLEVEGQNKDAEFELKDVQYINAEVKLVKCIVENIVVDISFNQIGGLCTLCFLDKVDQEIGKNHLFKRSIILIKAWCFYESRILGAHHGLISTYALETMVLYVFNLFHKSLDAPLAVLYRFLDYYSKFDWDNYCVSLQGPVSISSLPEIIVDPRESDGSNLLLSQEFLKECADMFSVPQRFLEDSRAFSKKHLNIVDPLKQNNNLGRSVSKGNFHRICSAFTYGAQKLGGILLLPIENVAAEVSTFFTSTLERHGTGERPDVQDACPSFSDSRVIQDNEIGSTSYKELNVDLPIKGSNGTLCEEINNIKILDLDEDYDTQLQFNRVHSNHHLDGLHKRIKMKNHHTVDVSSQRLDIDARHLGSLEHFRNVDESCNASACSDQIGVFSSGKCYHAPDLLFHIENGRKVVTLDKMDSRDTAKEDISLSRSTISDEGTNYESELCHISTSWSKTNPMSVSTGSIHGSLSTSWNSNLPEYSKNADCSNEGNGNTSLNPKCSKLSDLTSDFNLHCTNFFHALEFQGHEYFMNQYILPVHGLSPTRYGSKHHWNISQQGAYMHIAANGRIRALPFSPAARYPINQSLIPNGPNVYGAKDIQKARGTGTYFPNMNSRPYRERQPGRGNNQMSSNQLSRSHSNGQLEPQDANLLEEGCNDTLYQPHSPFFSGNDRGKSASSDVLQSSHSSIGRISNGNGSVHHLERELEFGSLGPVPLRVSSTDKSNQIETVTPFSQVSAVTTLVSTNQGPVMGLKWERPIGSYQLKDEGDFPPL
ncbi:hypothetical protein Cni_G15090 [Canna indica]|uniref:PAP/OAS1 substrate-binding domain superfamily n=1 Tax=Canna indica TaxID=4628 RepID=A0AAQ3QEK4_9LILI|nr:hypothetical protein Cni_G15090 [Canna indica]